MTKNDLLDMLSDPKTAIEATVQFRSPNYTGDDKDKFIETEIARITTSCLKEPGFWFWTSTKYKTEITEGVERIYKLMDIVYDVSIEAGGVHFRVPFWDKDAY